MTRVFDTPVKATSASALFEINPATGDPMQKGEAWEFAVPQHLQGSVLREATLVFRKDPAHWHTSLEGFTQAEWDPMTGDPNPPRIALEARDRTAQTWRKWRNPDYNKTSKRAEVGTPEKPEHDAFHECLTSLGSTEPDRIRLVNRGKGDPNHAIATVHSLELTFFPNIKNPNIIEKIYSPGTAFSDLTKGQMRPTFGGGPEHGGRYPGALVLGEGRLERAAGAAALPKRHRYHVVTEPGDNMSVDAKGQLHVPLQAGSTLGGLEMALGDVDLVATQKRNVDKHRGRKGGALLDAYIQCADGQRIDIINNNSVPPRGVRSGVPAQDGYVIQPGDELIVNSRDDVTYVMGMRLIMAGDDAKATESQQASATGQAGQTGSAVEGKRPEVALPEFYDKHLSRDTSAKVGLAQVTPGPDGVGRVDVAALCKRDDIARILIETAADHNVTVGFWGGTARDFLTQRNRDVTSDFDLMYNSAEPGLDAFKKDLIQRFKDQFGKQIPWVDLSVDMNPDKQMRGPYRGLSVEKIGVLGDGRVFDFTGRGLQDMQDGVLHYNAPTPEEGPGISSVFRMTGAQLQNPTAEFDAETHAMLRRVLDEFYAPGTQSHQELKAFYDATKDMGRRELKQYVKAQRAAHGGRVPGEKLLDFMKTLKYIVNGGVATDPKHYLDTLDRVGISGFLQSLGAGAKLEPLREAAGQP